MGANGTILRTTLSTLPVGVEEDGSQMLSRIPSDFRLDQNYPNPFNPSTVIRYQLPAESRVTLKIFNLLGQEIETLVNDLLPAGTHEATWEAEGSASGVYFYQLQAGAFFDTKKLLLLK